MSKPVYKYIAMITAGSFLGLVTCVFLFYHKGYFGRTITHGGFYGLSIGDTKDETLKKLGEHLNVSGITPRLNEQLEINNNNLDAIHKLLNFPAFQLSGSGVFAVVSHDGVNVTSILPELYGPADVSFSVGDDLEEVFAILTLQLQNDPDVFVAPTIPNRRAVLIHEEPSKEEVGWLNQYDVWGFGEDDQHTYFILNFANNHLSAIRFQRYISG